MAKVAINCCYGGFSISEAAVQLAREISGNPTWGGVVLHCEEESPGNYDWGSYHLWETERTDPVLIQVIETLGDKANGAHSDLCIATVAPGRHYRIREYDGYESIEERDDIHWEIG
jgi:hypothetical protein